MDRWITRSAEPWGNAEPEPEQRNERGQVFTGEEVAEFLERGGEINDCGARAMKRDLHRAWGWKTELTNSSRWKLFGPHRQLLFTGASPPDWCALQNLRADVRRAERRGDK
jgi:hypothetical protein